ncbi:MAG TPA: hypothetical protein VN776_13870 [Terracidiphilus sp.]|nr:hypothetical protein [Terracidiphilus sp.]
MDKVALVSFDIETGEKVIEALDRDGKEPKVALWAKLPEYEDWRLVIASDRIVQTGSLYPYAQINSAMEKAGIPISKRPKVFLRSMDKPFIKALRGIFSKAADTYGMRLGGQAFGDQYLEDAFVYRIR